MRKTIALPLLLALAAGSGCRDGEDATTAATGGTEAPPPEPPPPPEPVEIPFDAAALDDAGRRVEIAPEGTTAAVPADASFELRSERAFRSLRVRLFDRRDRLVPSTDEITIGQGTTVRLVPADALEEGERYRLVIDEPRGEELRDVEDLPYLPRSYRFTVEAPPDEGAGGNGGE